MYRLVFGILLVTHGLAHIFDLIALLSPGGQGKDKKPGASRSRRTLTTFRSRVNALSWLAAAWLLTGAGIGIFLSQDWWTTLAIIGAVLSMTAIVPWWNITRRSARLGVLLDLTILVGLLTPIREKIIELIG